jgi:UDP-N-acetylglucosamine 4-epimerase
MYNLNLYQKKYHTGSISDKKILVTGGAGFIGSNIVEYLLKNNVGLVRVLDNLSNGYLDNIKQFIGLPNFEFIEGDIRSIDDCKMALEGINYVSHQAALGSVPRSINDPITTNEVNVGGFLNILTFAQEAGSIRNFVYAASSSTYGDSKELPKKEGFEGDPLSPYAVTKLVNELYAKVFSRIYNFNSIGLRYFNVFGPKQNPKNPYAAVIPLFCNAAITGDEIKIFGDGNTSRDFTFVENAVQANIRALLYSDLSNHEVFNVACGEQITLNQIVQMIKEIKGDDVMVRYEAERVGDIRHSKADIEKIKAILDYNPSYNFKEGLEFVYKWYSDN